MMVPYPMLKFGHFTGIVRSGDIVLWLWIEVEGTKFYKK
jgi:hypothetical protein